MKNYFPKTILLLFVLALVSCKSTVSLQDMRKQQADALKELENTRQSLLELASMKEKFSVDYREEQIKALETKRKEIEKDISSVQNVSSTTAEEGKSEMIKNLEKRKKELDKEIVDYRKIEKENWTAAKDSINRKVNELQIQINRITENLQDLEEVKK